MKLTSNKIFSFMLAAAFALTLAGCGGGGGSAAVEEEPPAMPEPTAQEMCEGDGGRYNADGSCTSAADLAEEMALSGAQSAAAAAATAAMAAVGGAVDPVAASNAYGYAKMAAEANTAAQAATTSADAMGHQMAAETAQGKAEDAAGTTGLGLIMLSNKRLNGDDIDNATLDGTDVPKEVNNAKNVGAAITDAADNAAAFADGFTNQGGMSGTDTQVTINGTSGTAVVVHKAGGSTFTLEHGSGNPLLQGETPSRFHTKGNWEGQDLLRVVTANEVKAQLVVSTDIQATTKKDTYTQDAGDADISVNSVITGDVPNDGSDFVASYNAVPTDNNAPRSGEIYCPSAVTAGCAISVDEDGKVTTVSGYKISHAKTTEDDVDGDYLAWGMWVQASIRDSIPDPAPTNLDAQAGAFAYGSQVFAVVPALSGTATYNGVANGLYSAGGMVQYFDADATLEADFGGATNVGGKISGSISNIRAAGQAVDGTLGLMRGDIAAEGTFSGMTDGVLGGNGFRGTYGGQVYGPAARTGASASVVAATFPTTAAGTFGASTQDGKMSLIGAFGSWKAE